MKNVLLSAILVLSVILVGCQENSALDPISSSNNASLLKPTPNTGVLDLKGEVVVGSVGIPVTYHVSGLALYEYTIDVTSGKDPVIEFSIETAGSVRHQAHAQADGTFGGESIEILPPANSQGIAYVQKDYFIPELSSKIHFIIAFNMDNAAVSIQSMWMDDVNVEGSMASTN
jgi:hypothetical protein